MVQIQEMEGYEAKDFSDLLGTEGFSDELLKTHFKLYEGYVKHTNKALDLLRSGDLDDYSAGEVRRRFVWEFNGMRLHEYYFGNMTEGGEDPGNAPTVTDAISQEFGSIEDWQEDLQDVGGMRGIGWACLTYDPQQRRLHNIWINEHDAGSLAGAHPLVLLDVFEHAFIADYGKDKDAYMEAFFNALAWNEVEERFKAIVD